MSTMWVLVLMSLLGNLSVTQSRPRDRSHRGLYEAGKTVPFVDKPYESGAMFGEYWNNLGKADTTNTEHASKFDDLYDKYNKEHGRVVGDGKDNSVSNDEEEDKIMEQVKEIEKTVEGGTEDMTSMRQDKAKEESKNTRRRHRNRDGGPGKRHGKKYAKKEEEDKKKDDASDELEETEFDFDKYFKQHPDFQKNVATITDKAGDSNDADVEKDKVKEEEKDTKVEPVVHENEPDDNDDEGVGDSDSDDDDDAREQEEKEKHKDDSLKESDSHDLSSEMYEDYYDYYDEDDDSSYSSSEMEAEARAAKMSESPYDWFKEYDRMYGDQPAVESEEKPEKPDEEKDDGLKTDVNVKDQDEKTETETDEKEKEKDEDKEPEQESKGDNIPKTAIEPSTSPNPPTPKKDVKSTVTQPAYPQWKRRTDTWNYIESKPIEACNVNSDCSAGRMCKFGLCLCGQPDFCDGHSKPVCGSDGRLYPSHCELHRTACVLGVHIRIDYDALCMKYATEKKTDATEAPAIKIEIKAEHPTTEVSNPEIPVATTAAPVVKVEETTSKATDDSASQDQQSEDSSKSLGSVDITEDVVEGGAAAEVTKDVVIDHVEVPETESNSDEVHHDNIASPQKVDENFDEEEDEEDFDSESEDDYDLFDSDEFDVSDESDEDEDYEEDEMLLGEGDEIEFGTADKPSLVPLFCTPDLYMQFKADVLEYHCIFFEEKNCDRQTQEEKQKLAALMFNYFDRNLNSHIEQEELWEMQLRESMDELSSLCTLLDIVTFDELGKRDGKLSADEFIQAFDIPDLLEHRLEVVPLMATIGNGLEVKCDVTDSTDVVWKRDDMDLSLMDFPGISVLDDGSLYLETVGFHHVGNLTCNDRKKPTIKQVHMFTVQKPPHVVLSAQTRDVRQGGSVVIHCHADGYPKPTVEWQFEDQSVEQGVKYHIQNYDNSLTVTDMGSKDSGVYKCLARNKAGSSEATVQVTVHQPNESASSELDAEETFVIFHDDGYTMHEPSDCLTQRHVKPDFGNFFFIPDELDAPPTLCEAGQPCSWGGAVNVKDAFVYATQPQQNRIVVIDVRDTFNPNQVIFTDHTPVSLYYLEHLDEVWVLCWNGEDDTGSKTVVIIRNASQKTQHHSIHTQPIGNRFDLVQDIYLPTASELHHPYKFGYTVHNGQQGLFKVDLVQKKYIKAVDFTKYDCVPRTLAFVPLGGHILVQCVERTPHGDINMILQLDYVTDMVTKNMTMPGVPYVSPDSSNVVVVNEKTGKVTVFQVHEDGQITQQFEVTVGSPVGEVTFHKASYTQGYDLYMTSVEAPVIFSVSLINGKVDAIRDIGEPETSSYKPWFKRTRPLVSGDVFSEFLGTTASSSLVILSGKHHSIQCDFRDLKNPSVITYTHLDKK